MCWHENKVINEESTKDVLLSKERSFIIQKMQDPGGKKPGKTAVSQGGSG